MGSQFKGDKKPGLGKEKPGTKSRNKTNFWLAHCSVAED